MQLSICLTCGAGIIKYKDGETVSIWKRGSEAHPFSYMALNVADARPRKPNKAFNLLCEMLVIVLNFVKNIYNFQC